MRINRINKKTPPTDPTVSNFSEIDKLLAEYKGRKGTVIPILQGVQEILGYLPPRVFQKIADNTGIPVSDLYGVATFYAQFRLHPVGKLMIKVCHGTACHVQNASAVSSAIEEALGVKDGETTSDGLFTLESVACLGCCSLAPVMMIGNDTYGKLTGAEAVKIIKEIRQKEMSTTSDPVNNK